MPVKNGGQRIETLLAGITEDVFANEASHFQDNALRVERILLEMVRPDPVQPRRVLPEAIHIAFHHHRLTPVQALRELVQLVQVAARQRGRPFNQVLELLPDGDDETPEDTGQKLSPEEQLLRDLVNLAVTIRDDGQVNPLTVVDKSEGVSHHYQIETGERRDWATWLLRDFIPGYSGDSMIPCIVTPVERASVFRQAKENTARSGLSAIALARQAALLLLTVHGYEIPHEAVSNDFYRQALELDLRGKREFTEAVLSAMGGIKKMHFSEIKALLRLSDEAMELADRHGIEEKKLRYVVGLAPEFHVEIVRQIIDFNLTSKQVKDLCSGDGTTLTDDTDPKAALPPAALKLAKVAHTSNITMAQDLARAMVHQEGDVDLARVRLQSMRKLLVEAERYLTES